MKGILFLDRQTKKNLVASWNSCLRRHIITREHSFP